MNNKFLIIRLSSIGDIVLTSPVVRCLKNQIKDAEIHFVVKQKHKNVVLSNPYITKVHTYDRNMSGLIKELTDEKFTCVIDLHNNIRSTRIKQSLNVPSVTFRKLNIKKFLLTHLKINRLPKIHIVDRYLETCSGFGIKNDGNGLDYFIDAEDNFNPSALSPFFQKGYIVFVIGGTYFTKRLPSEKIVEICSHIDYPVILLGGKNEVKSGNFIESNSKRNVLNLAGKLSLNQSASLVRDARLVLTNDTGLMHIAAAFKKKILSFWGNTVPDFGMFPYLPDESSEIIEISDLSCRPCSKIGYDKCPKKHFRCMNEISTDTVTNWIMKNY